MPTDTGGSNLGNKLKGVVEVVHGAGENLRGAFMGALDTFTNDESTPHDDIVRQGKLEMERGFAHLRSSKEKGQGSFAIGSTAPPVSYTHNKAGTGGIEKVQEANIPGPKTYETGMDRGIVPNTGDHTTSTNPEKLESIQHQGDAMSERPTQELHNHQDEHSGSLSKSTVQERSEYDPSHAPYRKQTAEFAHPEGSSNLKVVPEDRKDGTKEGSTTVPAVNPPSPGLVN